MIEQFCKTLNNLRKRLNSASVRWSIQGFLALLLVYVFGNFTFLEFMTDSRCQWDMVSNWPFFIISLLIQSSFFFITLNLVRLSAFFSYTVFFVINITQYAVYYSQSRYGALCQEFAVAAINATPAEVMNYINVRSFIHFFTIIAGLLVLIQVYRYFFRIEATGKKKLLIGGLSIGVGILLFVLPTAILHTAPKVAECMLWPVVNARPDLMSYQAKRTRDEVCHYMLHPETPNDKDLDYYNEIYSPIRDTVRYYGAIWNFLNPPTLQNAGDMSSRITMQKLPDKVVFYIGESFRADHNPMNGYHRNTLPQISKMTNIINFPDLHCQETQTISSIYSFLVLKDEKKKPKYTSFLDILKKHGYSSHLMVGANSGGAWYNTPLIAPIFKNCIALHSRPSSPEEYAQGIYELSKKHKGPIFIMIEDGAGHMPYTSRTHPFGSATEIDRYDNALVDIDTTVSTVIQSIHDEDTILFFTSDHGESFGENGRRGHGGPSTAKEQTHVAGFVWYSDSYAKNHPEVIAALKTNASKFNSLDQVYHTILSICGISSELQINSEDMTKPYQKN